MELIDTVKNWMAANRPHMSTDNIHLDTQDGANDMHFAKSSLLPGVTSEHVNEDDYHVATVTDSITVEGGFVIPKIIKLTVKNNEVQKVLESK